MRNPVLSYVVRRSIIEKAFLETNLAASTKMYVHFAQVNPLLGKEPTKMLTQIHMYRNFHYSAAKVKI